jgi:hypothetical protein
MMMRMKDLLLVVCSVGIVGLSACDSDPQNPLGDTAQPVDQVDEPAEPAPILTVISVLNFTREHEPGIAVGFNVDDKVSKEGDESTCGHGDFVSPEGEEGIDNQLALITPLFDTVGIGAVEGFVQAAVDEGGLLIMWELAGVDDIENDDDVTVTLRYGTGAPLLGTDGVLISGQTFHLSPDSPNTIIQASISDGQLRTERFTAGIPIVVFEVRYELQILDAQMRGEITFDGQLSNAMMGGRVPIANLIEIAERAEMEAGGIYDAVLFVLDGMGDMNPDANGVCQDISTALTFTAASAFFYPGELDGQ